MLWELPEVPLGWRVAEVGRGIDVEPAGDKVLAPVPGEPSVDPAAGVRVVGRAGVAAPRGPGRGSGLVEAVGAPPSPRFGAAEGELLWARAAVRGEGRPEPPGEPLATF